MRTAWLFKLLFTLPLTLRAQDHLIPARDFFFKSDHQQTYHNLIRSKLLKDLSEWPLARVVVTPSFEEEYVVTLDTSRGDYFLVFRIMETSLWSPTNDPTRTQENTFLERRRHVSRVLAAKLTELFFNAVSQSRYPPIKYFVMSDRRQAVEVSTGADGTMYYFSSIGDGFGVRTGEVWSPETDTLMGQLVALTNRMVAFAKGSTKETDQTLQQAAQALNRQLVKPLR